MAVISPDLRERTVGFSADCNDLSLNDPSSFGVGVLEADEAAMLFLTFALVTTYVTREP
jgi:hypothetical protein